MTSPLDVSVIFISWNSLELTTTAIRTLREKTEGVTYEIVVVDNGSTRDGGAPELARRFADVRVIANGENRGYSHANNQGITVATGRYVLLLNSDTEQTENAIGKAVQYMDAHQGVGVLGVMHRNGDAGRTYQPSSAVFPDPWRRALDLLMGGPRTAPPPSKPPPESDVDWVTGSFFMIRRECLQSVGPLDEDYFVYNEDIDWCLQASRKGWRVRFWPGASLVHFGSSSAAQLVDKTFMLFRNELRYFRKNCNPLAVTMYYAAMSVRLFVSTAVQAGKYLVGKARWEDVRERSSRLSNFTFLRSERQGVGTAR